MTRRDRITDSDLAWLAAQITGVYPPGPPEQPLRARWGRAALSLALGVVFALLLLAIFAAGLTS